MKRKDKNKLDKLASEKCKDNAGWKCEVCGKTKDQVQLHCHHVIGRRHFSLRWHLDNLTCLCASHHTLGLRSAHEHPIWFRKEMIGIRGQDWLDEIEKRSQTIWKGTFQQVKDYLDDIKGDY